MEKGLIFISINRNCKTPMFYCALYQNNIEIKERLKRSLRRRNVKFLPFSEFAQLERLIQKYILDIVVISGAGSFINELNFAKRIKKHPVLSLAPLVLYHPHPSLKAVLDGFNLGADEFFFSQWHHKLYSSKLKMIINRSRRDLGVNPTTRLPGTSIIEREISRRIKKGEEFAACYADLDNFKAYNDYYGYQYGDSLIKMSSEIIRDVVYSSTKNGFVGHIGGDDFVFVIPPEKIHTICDQIIKIFDRLIIRRYKKEDVLRGSILTTNRKGKKENSPS